MLYGNPQWLFDFAGGGWDWYVSLRHPKRGDSKDDFVTWVGWLEQNIGNGDCISYIRVIEPKDGDSVVFHLLFRGVPAESRWGWRKQWNDLSGGTSWDRPLTGTGEGLIRHFFFESKFLIIAVVKGQDIPCKFGRSEHDEVELEDSLQF